MGVDTVGNSGQARSETHGWGGQDSKNVIFIAAASWGAELGKMGKKNMLIEYFSETV